MKTERTIGNILVTGGAGFIGSAFIRYLFSPEVLFKNLCVNYDALTYAGNIENVASVMENENYIFQQGDINDEELLEETCKKYDIRTIIHFAAESHVDRSILGPQKFIKTNILGTFHLLEVVRKNPLIHFHHVSTDEVFGSLGSSGYFTETTPYNPKSPYSASKASSDHLVRSYAHTYQLSTTLSNCSNNYGPFQFPEKLIPLIILNCLNRQPLPVYGEGENVRDWLHVDDHVKALYTILLHGELGETYAIGGGAERSNIQVIQEIIRIIADMQGERKQDLEQLILFVADRPGHDWRYAIDSSKIKNMLGWSPQRSFSEGLKQTILWYMENENWVKDIQSGAYRKWMETNYATR